MNIFNFASLLINTCKKVEPINNKSDYYRIKRWKNKASFMYIIFTAIAVLLCFSILDNASTIFANIDLPEPLAYVVIPIVIVLTAWGFATMLLNFKLLIKSMWNASADGYRTGEQIQTTNTYITHEYGNQYSVRTETENQGCVVAMINGFINLFVWAFLCVYVCPFLTFSKINKTKKLLRRYR